MNDLITLAIPIYNVERYVEIALLSALNQTYENIEYIIVDDKGTDRSMDIVRSIIATHHRGKDVKIVEHEKNIGLGAGRNSGIAHATGKYIFFMDSDDEISPDCIKILYHSMKEHPVDFVASSIETRDRNGETIAQSIHKERHLSGAKIIVNDYYMSRNRHVTVWNKLYDLSFLRNNNIRCIPAHLNEDNLFTFQVILNAQSCSYISAITYYYYDTPDSIVKTAFNYDISTRYARQYVECINFKRDYIQNFKEVEIRENVYRYIIFQTIYYALLIKRSKILHRAEKKAFLKELILFPFDISEIKKLKNKLFFLIMYMVYAVPFTVTCFRLIRYLSSRK